MKTRVLTGITTSGTPHLGNYVGAIRPSVAASRNHDVDAFYFLADYHALIKCDDLARVMRSRLEIAATWLACGLDPERVTFYRQSDIPEIPELTWILTCVAPKGLMNRAHAYKAAVDANSSSGEDADAGINLGLYSYPVLMAADILIFNAHRVPVGRDQVQHIEMARDERARWRSIRAAGSDAGGTRGDLAGPRRPQDEQELRQHRAAVRRRIEGYARSNRKDRHRLARTGRAEAPGQLFSVCDLSRVRVRVRCRGLSRSAANGPGLGRGETATRSADRVGTGRCARKVRAVDGASGRNRGDPPRRCGEGPRDCDAVGAAVARDGRVGLVGGFTFESRPPQPSPACGGGRRARSASGRGTIHLEVGKARAHRQFPRCARLPLPPARRGRTGVAAVKHIHRSQAQRRDHACAACDGCGARHRSGRRDALRFAAGWRAHRDQSGIRRRA